MAGVTVKEIAERAGVSLTTAYQILRNPQDRRYAKATRERVVQVARAAGYTPNRIAWALATKKSLNIGLVGVDWYDPHKQRALREADRIALAHEHNLLVTTAASCEHWYRLLLEHKVDLIITIGFVGGRAAEVPPEARGRIVALGPAQVLSHPERYWGWSVTWDDVAGGASAADHLLDLGHTELAVLSSRNVTERTLGFVRRARERGCCPWLVLGDEDRDDMVVQDDFPADRIVGASLAGVTGQTARGSLQLEELFRHAPNVTGVFCRTDRIAAGAVVAALRRGIRVPEDLSVVGYTDSIQVLAADYGMTTVRTPIAEAVSLVLDTHFRGGMDDNMPGDVVLSTQLVARETTCTRTSATDSPGE